ncbi:MAG: glycerol kinase, partial [Oscillospiraceae bacterium]|nr:glycerol kinase [Oscillospiraceae bacterium]
AMNADAATPLSVLRVDGGASVSRFMMQFQADVLRIPIDRPAMVETTAFGAAFLAGLEAGVWDSLEEIKRLRASDRIFRPTMPPDEAAALCARWQTAAQRSEGWAK